MSHPTAISPEEQEQIARRIGVLLLQGAPEDWQQITVEYRATGEYHDLLGETARQDGSTEAWEPPEDLLGVFEHLREGMYRPDVGTWLSALYIVERPSSYRIDINFDEEPQWQQPLPRAAYVDELRRYPRADENVPDWMRAKLDGSTSNGVMQSPPPHAATPAATGPPPVEAAATEPQDAAIGADPRAVPHDVTDTTGPGVPGDERHFRTARSFDDFDEQGRPLVTTRLPVPVEESGSLRQYLENAPIVLASRDNDPDELDPERPAVVPATWHTDGTWLWPGALAYYLAQYGLPPESELLDHIRSRRFALSEIDDRTRDAAVGVLFEQPAPEATPTAGHASAPEQDEPRTDGPVVTGADGEDSDHSAVDRVDDPAPEESTAENDAAAGADESPHGFTPGTDEDLGSEGTDEDLGTDENPDAAEDLDADDTGADGAGHLDSSDPGSSDLDNGEQEPWRPEPEAPLEVGSVARHGRTDEDDDPDAPDSETVFDQLRDKLSGHGVDAGGYRIGSRAEDTWSLADEGSDWVVTGPGDSPGELRFARPDQAAAYLLGSVLMSRDLPAPEAVDESAAAEVPTEAPRETPALADLPPRSVSGFQRQRSEEAGGNFLFTANQPPQQDSAPADDSPADDSPAAQGPDAGSAQEGDTAAGQEHTRMQPVPGSDHSAAPPPQTGPSAAPPPPAEPASAPPAANGAAPAGAAGQGPPPLPKRQPRAERPGTASPQADPAHPAPASPPHAGGPAGTDQRPPGPGGPGMAGPPRPGEPPRPPQPGGPGEPPARPNGVLNRPPQSGPAEPPRPPQAAPGGQAPAAQGPPQPIEPLQGEPPLTLYRDRRTVVLQPGTDLDRFGEPSGNVAYAIRTPYAQRSLPPQWVDRTYLAYRVQRPVQVLRGTAVPWFEQQGGGTAYVLPGAIGDLVANGTLIALSGNEAPPRPSME